MRYLGFSWRSLLLAASVVTLAACGSQPDDTPEAVDAPASPASEGAPGILVSPELFDLASRWSGDSGLSAASTAAWKPDLLSYVRSYAPEYVRETQGALASMASGTSDSRSAQSGCRCQVWATFDKPAAWPSGPGWNLDVKGAAHKGRIHQSESGKKIEQTSNYAVYRTQFKTRMVCLKPDNSACVAGCTAKLYADVQYSTQVYATADTGGIWSKGATGQVVDGVTLYFAPPFSSPGTMLFEKAASVSHEATTMTYDVNSVATLVKNSLSIGTAIVSGDPSKISGDLVDSTIRAIFGLRHQSGAGGNTAQGLNVIFESPFWQPIPMNYSSQDHLYYALNLSSDVRMKTRGYGGWHRAEATTASSYGMAVYVDNFVCDSSVTTPPARSAFWRYDGFDGSATPVSSIRGRIQSFFFGAFGTWVDVSANEGTIYQGTCGDGLCGGLESDLNCVADCVRCGDNVCSPSENVNSCPGDCGYCGDAFCSSIEDADSCRMDCGWCGDAFCGANEDAWSCSQDCGWCGNGMCEPNEDPSMCIEDCGWCGDGFCSANESYLSCGWDCP